MSAPKHYKVEVRITEGLYDALNAEAAALTEELGFEVTRSDVMRTWLSEGAAGRARRRTLSDSPKPSADRRERSGSKA